MKKNLIFGVLILFALVSCAPSVQQTTSSEPLRNYKVVFVRDTSSNQGISGTGGSIGMPDGGIASANVLSAADAAQQAAQSLAFELEFIGFNLTNNLENADAIVDFSIGTVRFDPLAGWIADQALARFVNARSGETIAAYRARTQLVTPTTRALVNDLASAIRANY